MENNLEPLSALLRRGAAIRQGCKWKLFARYEDEKLYGAIRLRSCAMGAIYEAVTGRADAEIEIEQVVTQLAPLGYDFKRAVRHPVNGNIYRLDACIASLNDQIGWSREQIADWLQNLEDTVWTPQETA